MNQLSWLLYLGNVVANLGPLFTIVGIIIIGLAIFLWVGHRLDQTEYMDHWHGQDAERKPSIFLPVSTTIAFIVFFFLAALCPSQDTVYAIAASQVGEQALKTPTAIKAEKAIDSWLDKQIANNHQKD